MTPELRRLIDSLPKSGRQQILDLLIASSNVAPNEAKVLGSVYTKQADVLIASWARGTELLVSTKTMLSSYAKNLRNRFEEAYGDAKNLRGRYPLAAMGFVFAVRSDIPKAELVFARDMLRKLRAERDVYDASCLVIVHYDDVEDPAAVEIIDDSAYGGDLAPAAFMSELVDAVLRRTPADHHAAVRHRRDGIDAVGEGEVDPDSASGLF